MRKAENLVAREQLLFHRLLYDLKLEAAKVGHNLLATTPEVDRDGYDVAFWMDTDVKFVQCKAFVGAGPTSWAIHKKVISPSPAEKSDVLHRERWFTHEGFGGGVLAISAQPKDDELEITYRFADLLTIWALAQGLVRKRRDVRPIATRFLEECMTDHPRVRIPRALLLRPRTNAHLMAMMGLESVVPNVQRSNLRHVWVKSRGKDIDEETLNAIDKGSIMWLRMCSPDLLPR